jgi:hypothetical protein
LSLEFGDLILKFRSGSQLPLPILLKGCKALVTLVGFRLRHWDRVAVAIFIPAVAAHGVA